MRVYDTFMYNGEADILECRLTELYDVVDVFVIVEASHTHGGNIPKPFHYLDFEQRFRPWHDKIHYVMISRLPEGDNPWERENAQRNHIMDGLHDAEDEDIIMISDVDEIPKASYIPLIEPYGHTVFMMKLYCMTLNWYDSTPWFGTVACAKELLTTPQDVRNNRRGAEHSLHSAGWHLSWMGDDAAREAKFHRGCHYNDYPPQWDVATGMFLGTQLRRVVYNNTYPKWVTEGHAPSKWFEVET